MGTRDNAVVKEVIVGIALLTASLFLCAQQSDGQVRYDPKAKTAKEAIEQVVMANRILSNEGIFDYLGHVSVRNPENPKTFFIARALAPEMVTKDDILEVDLDGKVLTKTSWTPYSERIIHGAIYKARPDVNSVLHAHPLPIIAFSIVDVPVKPIIPTARFFSDGVPVYDEYDSASPKSTGLLVTTKEEGDRIAKCLGNRPAMLMRGHGFNAAGASVPDCVFIAISLRDSVLLQMMALQLGKPKYMSAQEAEATDRARGGLERGWNYWVARAKRAYPDLN